MQSSCNTVQTIESVPLSVSHCYSSHLSTSIIVYTRTVRGQFTVYADEIYGG